MDIDIEEHIKHWASLCKDTNTGNRVPRSWNTIIGDPNGWKTLFNDSVVDAIQESNKTTLVEMALPLKEFRKRVDRLRFQLIENWCLCKFCQLYSQDNDNFGHWISEFNACAKNIRDFEIKGRIDKKKTISSMFIDDYDYDKRRKILVIIREKFDAENIMDVDIRTAVATSFAESVNSLIDFLSYTDKSISEYVLETFGFEKY